MKLKNSKIWYKLLILSILFDFCLIGYNIYIKDYKSNIVLVGNLFFPILILVKFKKNNQDHP